MLGNERYWSGTTPKCEPIAEERLLKLESRGRGGEGSVPGRNFIRHPTVRCCRSLVKYQKGG